MLNWIRHRSRASRPAAVLRARLGLECLEDRAVPAGLGRDLSALAPDLARQGGAAVTTVYTETNNPNPGLNAVLAFHRNADGSLRQIGKFSTGGTGQLNVPKLVGPDDGDQEVIATPDGRFLFAVNQGSHSVSSFRIRNDGGLSLVGTFDSGGVQPDSVGYTDGRVYVANRGDAAAGHTGSVAPNITGFDVDADGVLSPIPNATAAFPIDTFATQALVSRDGRFLFGVVASLGSAPQGNTLAPFQIRSDGTLLLAPGGNVAASANPALLLGAAAHPLRNIIYSGLTGAGQVGVYTYDETGRTSFVGSSADQGRAPCWITVSADGRVLYVANTGTDSIGVYSLADPLHPVQIQELTLRGPHLPPGGTGNSQSLVFEIALDPSGRSLYAVNQSTNPAFPQGNQFHALTVARDGTLTESAAPIVFSQADVPANAHPQGVAVVTRRGRSERDDGPRPAPAPPSGGSGGETATLRSGNWGIVLEALQKGKRRGE